jgi:Helix-turn-helix domain
MTADNIHTSATARKSRRDTFTITQFNWLRQVAYDADLVPAASRVAIAITKYFSRERDGWAWMSQATLANDLGMPERTVRDAISRLIKHGHIVTKRRGKMETNLYHLALKNTESDRQPSADHDRQTTAGHDGQPSATHTGVTGRNQQSDRQKTVKVTGSHLPPNPLNEPTEEPIEEEIDSPRLDLGEEEGRRGRNPKSESKSKTDAESEIGAAFESFWRQVIHKESKKEAERLYKRIVQKGEATPDQLMAAMLRFNASMAGRELKYIKRPLKWLREGCWTDESAAAPIGATIDGNGNPVNQPPPPDRSKRAARLSGMDIAMAGYRGERT